MQSGDPVYKDKAGFDAFQVELKAYEGDIENQALAEFRAAKQRHARPQSLAAGDAAHDAYYAYKQRAKDALEKSFSATAQRRAVDEWRVKKPFQEALAHWAKESANRMREVFSTNLKRAAAVVTTAAVTGGAGAAFGLTGAGVGAAATTGVVGLDFFKGLESLKKSQEESANRGSRLEGEANASMERARGQAEFRKEFSAMAEGAKSAAIRAGNAVSIQIPMLAKIESLAQASGEGRI